MAGGGLITPKMASSISSTPPGQTNPYPSPTRTGTIPFTPPGTSSETETWYALWGELSSSTVPSIVLHGGPGVAHNYLLPTSHLSSAPWSRTVILYDQLGCGKSTHLPDKNGDTDFWTPQLFMRESENSLKASDIETYDISGQSWGGMLGAQYATTRPKGLRRLIIADSPADMVSWVETADKLRKSLPEDVQETSTRCEKEGTTESEEYEQAVIEYLRRFVCRVWPFPKELADSSTQLKEDNTVNMTMNGPSEFFVTGSLKTWNIISESHKIQIPVLLVNGRFDEAQDVVMEPYFRGITGRVKWVRFAESSHTPQLEETGEFISAVGNFLEATL